MIFARGLVLRMQFNKSVFPSKKLAAENGNIKFHPHGYGLVLLVLLYSEHYPVTET